MSIADELLDSLIEDEPTTFTVDRSNEPHIVVNPDRSITIPDQLKNIAVQYDHNIETVTFDCIRYWDDHDFSKMHVYINYKRSDGFKDQYLVDNLRVDDEDENIIHFEWTISRNVTLYKGNITFLVCVKSVDDAGNETPHWNSQLNSGLTVLEGLECSEEIAESNHDIIETLLARMEFVEEVGGATDEQVGNAVSKYFEENPVGGVDFETDESLILKDGVLSINTTNQMEQDNTLPITSAGVYATVGNIEALLKTI